MKSMGIPGGNQWGFLKEVNVNSLRQSIAIPSGNQTGFLKEILGAPEGSQ